MEKTFEQLLTENKELMDFVVGMLMAANLKFALLRRLYKSETPHDGSKETLLEGFNLVNQALEKVVDDNHYTDKDMYMLMQKYKGG